jgi:hypothetical protein
MYVVMKQFYFMIKIPGVDITESTIEDLSRGVAASKGDGEAAYSSNKETDASLHFF